MSEKNLTFLGHLEELRRVLLRSLWALAAGTGIALFFSPKIFLWLQYPMQRFLPEGSHFIVTSPFEAYFAYFRIALVFGLLITSPLIFYFIWSFIHPGLKPEERRGVIPVALVCAALFAGGALFGYFVVFPTGFQFAVKVLSGTDIWMMPRMSDYLSLSLRLLLAFGLIFELPLFLALLGRFGLVSASKLRQTRKYIVVAIFLVAGILTPGPDILSQILMALPLMVLFELGIVLVRITEKRRSLRHNLRENEPKIPA